MSARVGKRVRVRAVEKTNRYLERAHPAVTGEGGTAEEEVRKGSSQLEALHQMKNGVRLVVTKRRGSVEGAATIQCHRYGTLSMMRKIQLIRGLPRFSKEQM